MAGKPHIPLYPGDWLRDDVSGCSLAAQGLWLRMMFLAHDSTRYGYLEINGVPMPPEFIARRCGCDDTAQFASLFSELVTAGVPSMSDKGIVFSRRMVRDASLSGKRATAGRKGGKQNGKQHQSKKRSKEPPNTDTDNDIDTDNINQSKIDDGPPIYAAALPDELNHLEFRDVLARWLAYKGKKYKAAGLKTLISRAASLAKQHGLRAVVDAMERAIANGWKGWDQESSFNGAKQHANRRDNSAIGAGRGERSL